MATVSGSGRTIPIPNGRHAWPTVPGHASLRAATGNRDEEGAEETRDLLPLVVVVGPTAVGKSALANAIAPDLRGEIVSADSRQVYRYMDVGTAKPTRDEQARVRHHLIDVVDPDGEYTLATYQADAYRAIEDVHRRGHLPLLVGGTGLYVRAVVEGLGIPRVAPQPEIRAELEARLARDGVESLARELDTLDPVAAASVDRRNPRRLIRAIEVCRASGRPISVLQTAHPPPYRVLTIGLTRDRAALYRRIDERVDEQIRDGLVEENQRLLAMGYTYDLPSMSGLGYRQIGLYLRGEVTLPRALEILKFETHRFARQQYNWFRLDDERIRWLTSGPDAAERALHQIQRFLDSNRVRDAGGEA
jgi:tRNA dimethylallyltransferase